MRTPGPGRDAQLETVKAIKIARAARNGVQSDSAAFHTGDGGAAAGSQSNVGPSPLRLTAKRTKSSLIPTTAPKLFISESLYLLSLWRPRSSVDREIIYRVGSFDRDEPLEP